MRKFIEPLENIMTQLISEHEQLLGLIRRKIQAMRIARPALVEDCIKRGASQNNGSTLRARVPHSAAPPHTRQPSWGLSVILCNWKFFLKG